MPEQTFRINGDDKTLTMEMPENTLWQYRLTDSAGTLLAQQSVEEAVCTLQFGENTSLPLPRAGESYGLRIRFYREEPNLVILGRESELFSITEESLQFRKLNPKLETTAKNTLRLTWGETRGDSYEVQTLNAESGSWETLARVKQGEERTFQDLLEPEQTKQYRVVAAANTLISWPWLYLQ